MNLLLDTHVLIWLLDSSGSVGDGTRRLLDDPEVTVFLSPVSIWEVELKRSVGKIKIPADFIEYTESMYLRQLPFTRDHALAIQGVPLHHKDPFDRMLIAQAIAEELAVVTVDRAFSAYDIRVVDPLK